MEFRKSEHVQNISKGVLVQNGNNQLTGTLRSNDPKWPNMSEMELLSMVLCKAKICQNCNCIIYSEILPFKGHHRYRKYWCTKQIASLRTTYNSMQYKTTLPDWTDTWSCWRQWPKTPKRRLWRWLIHDSKADMHISSQYNWRGPRRTISRNVASSATTKNYKIHEKCCKNWHGSGKILWQPAFNLKNVTRTGIWKYVMTVNYHGTPVELPLHGLEGSTDNYILI